MKKNVKNSVDKNTKEAELISKEEQLEEKSRHAMPTILRVLLSFLFLIIMSLILGWFVLWQQYNQDAGEVMNYIQEKPALFSYSCLIILLILVTLSAILWKPFLSTALVFSGLAALMYANTQKYKFRSTPLVPGDFQLADGALMEFVDMREVVRLAIGIILVIIGAILLEHYAKKLVGYNSKERVWWERFEIVPRLSFVLIAVTALVMLADPVVHNRTEEELPWLEGLKFELCNQSMNYEQNGYIIAFMRDLGSLKLEAPEDYSKERVEEIAQKYRAEKQKDDAKRKPLSQVADNVVFIMNESFYDPAVLGEQYEHTGGDVTPNLHKIFEKYPSGYMYSPEYGGNTANVEFSAFTGLSNYWAQTVPYATFASKLKVLPGLISYAKENDFQTTALHPFNRTMYKRNLVYPAMQFDEFLDINTMDFAEKENGNGFVSDESVYKQILKILEDEKEPQAIGAITIQNHTPFDSAKYSTRQFKLKKDNVWHGDDVELTYENMHHADEYLGEFIEKLDKLDERTVVIWFGDHAAGALSDYATSDDQSLVNLVHLTPYFVYANFDLENRFSKDAVKELNQELGFDFSMVKGVDLPTVSPNCLVNTMYDLIGSQKPTLMYLEDAVCEDAPILAPSFYNEENPLEVTDVLDEYELVNYDLSSGKKYWLGASN